ncbi:hypothetical protein WJX75_008877 [Coccomyxa subellipsoidea]|uniref:Uncharacterized protein n=1 Tax=Coccomyxa subellipsoidea TaxID=248742 RepID=A0ABR2Z5K5_9CHLO
MRRLRIAYTSEAGRGFVRALEAIDSGLELGPLASFTLSRWLVLVLILTTHHNSLAPVSALAPDAAQGLSSSTPQAATTSPAPSSTSAGNNDTSACFTADNTTGAPFPPFQFIKHSATLNGFSINNGLSDAD